MFTYLEHSVDGRSTATRGGEGGVKVTEARRDAARRPSRERRSMPRERATQPRQQSDNRAENSHQPFRRRERAMQRFRNQKSSTTGSSKRNRGANKPDARHRRATVGLGNGILPPETGRQFQSLRWGKGKKSRAQSADAKAPPRLSPRSSPSRANSASALERDLD
jgi:hypothetical protein